MDGEPAYLRGCERTNGDRLLTVPRLRTARNHIHEEAPSGRPRGVGRRRAARAHATLIRRIAPAVSAVVHSGCRFARGLLFVICYIFRDLPGTHSPTLRSSSHMRNVAGIRSDGKRTRVMVIAGNKAWSLGPYLGLVFEIRLAAARKVHSRSHIATPTALLFMLQSKKGLSGRRGGARLGRASLRHRLLDVGRRRKLHRWNPPLFLYFFYPPTLEVCGHVVCVDGRPITC